MFSESVGNMRSFWFSFFFAMYRLSISRVAGFSLPFRPMVCFAPVTLTIPFSKLMSDTFSHVSSMGLVPMSLLIDKKRLILVFALAMIRSIFSSIGIFGCLSYLA